MLPIAQPYHWCYFSLSDDTLWLYITMSGYFSMKSFYYIRTNSHTFYTLPLCARNWCPHGPSTVSTPHMLGTQVTRPNFLRLFIASFSPWNRPLLWRVSCPPLFFIQSVSNLFSFPAHIWKTYCFPPYNFSCILLVAFPIGKDRDEGCRVSRTKRSTY